LFNILLFIISFWDEVSQPFYPAAYRLFIAPELTLEKSLIPRPMRFAVCFKDGAGPKFAKWWHQGMWYV